MRISDVEFGSVSHVARVRWGPLCMVFFFETGQDMSYACKSRSRNEMQWRKKRCPFARSTVRLL